MADKKNGQTKKRAKSLISVEEAAEAKSYFEANELLLNHSH